jgi:hypothetical protein
MPTRQLSPKEMCHHRLCASAGAHALGHFLPCQCGVSCLPMMRPRTTWALISSFAPQSCSFPCLTLQMSGLNFLLSRKRCPDGNWPDVARMLVACPGLLLEVLDTFAQCMGFNFFSFTQCLSQGTKTFCQPCHCPCNEVWR